MNIAKGEFEKHRAFLELKSEITTDSFYSDTYNYILQLEKNNLELVNSLGMSLDAKYRKLYLSELKETLNKYKQELL